MGGCPCLMLFQGLNFLTDMVLEVSELPSWLDDCNFVASSVGQLCIFRGDDDPRFTGLELQRVHV